MTTTDETIRERLERTGVLAILRLRDHGLAVEATEAMVRGGIEIFELTQDDPGALASLRAVREAHPEDIMIGAGTVLDVETVAAVAAAGAQFCVSPNLDLAVVAASREAGLEPLPGVVTPTEIALARAHGVELLKLFPGGELGIAYMKALHGPFEDAALIPTGGIEAEETGDWLTAGALAVGLGGSIFPTRPTEADLGRIEERAKIAVASAAEARPQ
jgi:Entner-Doudoroff aldolase